MADIVDEATRSRMMASIRGKDTKPEIVLRKALHSRGLRYRLHSKQLPGRPDLIFARYNAVVFVHGCFWHRHDDCRYTTTPKTREEFWRSKFAANVARDVLVQDELLRTGWRVATVWECALRTHANVEAVAVQLHEWLVSDLLTIELGE